jgi:expansin (peptidoglycan-binding protein)
MPLSMYERNNGGNCGQGVRIKANGRSVIATVVDSCPTCGPDDIDLSPSVFAALADGDMGLGVLSVKWNFLRRQ